MSNISQSIHQSVGITCKHKGDSSYLLKLTLPEDRKGIIYKVTAVLFAHNWDIEEAVAEPVDGYSVKEVFVIRSLTGKTLIESELNRIKEDLNSLFFGGLSVKEFIEKSGKDLELPKIQFESIVHVFNPPTIDSTVLDIRTLDRPGLLFEISKILYLEDIEIISFTAKNESKEIRDSFLLCNPNREKLEENVCEKLRERMLNSLG